MKREIKFRGLNANKEWVYGLISKDTEGSTRYYTEMPYRMCWFEDSAHCNQPVTTDSIGQFTGLLDKNGKEIYEGDIVKEKIYQPPAEYCGDEKYEVCFSEAWASFGLTDGGAFFNLHDHRNIEVIGNIYENPDLL